MTKKNFILKYKSTNDMPYDKKVYLTKNATKGFTLTGVGRGGDVYVDSKGQSYLYYGKNQNGFIFEKLEKPVRFD